MNILQLCKVIAVWNQHASRVTLVELEAAISNKKPKKRYSVVALVTCALLALTGCDDAEQNASGKLNLRAGYVYDVVGDEYVLGRVDQWIDHGNSTSGVAGSSPAVLTIIKKFEGFSPVPYRCAAGVLTVGFGHRIQPGERFARITEEQAERLLRQDLGLAEAAVLMYVRVPLTDDQYNALVSLTFNIGHAALADSTLLRELNKGNYDAIPAEMQRWVFASGKKNKGLMRRRTAEAELFLASN